MYTRRGRQARLRDGKCIFPLTCLFCYEHGKMQDLGSKCDYSIRVVVWFQHYGGCAVLALGLECGDSTRLDVRFQHLAQV